MKIKTILTLWFTILVSFLLIISNVIVFYGIKSYLYNQKSDEVRERGLEVEKVINALANERDESGEDFDIKDPELLSYTLSDQGTALYEGAYVQITDLDEEEIFSKSPTLENSKLPILKLETLGPLTLDLPTKKGKNLTRILYYATTIEIEKEAIAKVQIGLPLAKNEKLISSILFFMFIEIIISVLISILFGIFLSRKALQPMVKITNKVNSMEGNELLSLLDTKKLADDEIGKLAQTFNNLIVRISDAFEFQKRFISDSSHELKSPLTTIKGYAQLIIKRGAERPEIIDEGMSVIKNESERLEKLVNDMLNIAKTGIKVNYFVKINIIELIDELFKELSIIHPQLKLKNLDSELFVNGDYDSLKRVFINLIDNSLRAINDDNGLVEILVKNDDKFVYIRVKDNGIGISEEHLPHIFDRFYRVDSSRSRAKGGSGLGLSLVKEIIENHKGNISVKSTKDVGTKFIVKLDIV